MKNARPLRISLALSMILTIVSGATCDRDDRPAPPITAGYASVGGKTLKVNIVSSFQDRRKALRGAIYPDDRQSLLVLFPCKQNIHCYSSFSPVGATAYFFDDRGQLLDIQELPRMSETGITSRIESSTLLLCANKTADAVMLRPGDTIALPEAAHKNPPEPMPEVKIKGAVLHVETATTEDERARGLMYRDAMSNDHGMIFIYRVDDLHGYYMKNTRIPLSLAYIKSDMTISSIHDMIPLDETDIPSKEPTRYVLEANFGWFARNKIAEGDKVEFSESLKRFTTE